jgi:hypothetical protein
MSNLALLSGTRNELLFPGSWWLSPADELVFRLISAPLYATSWLYFFDGEN